MATTSPDNIFSPDANDPYALTQDLGAMATSVQSALVRRGNLYIGTSAQRTAFTSAPNGTHWQDTNGTQLEYVMFNGTWSSVGIRMAGGTVSSRSVVANGQSAVTVAFPSGRFSAAPFVTATTNATGVNARGISASISNVTSTGFTLSLDNTVGVARTAGAHWIAFQP